jgi:hypothetical protein
MYSTSGGEGKLYFVISQAIYIFLKSLHLIEWLMAWWYSPCLGTWDFKKVMCSNPPMGLLPLNLILGLPMDLLG